ncbi:type II toxin-antitoxin system RelE/ParE family toxin [Aquirufa regiilacus]|uniref:Type II toxin-antitoxin system RelE/ParE family toxin n=1 Tax=Aquirufa regiilacus TaxID=3024868 RepID=A0ABU3TTQ0_9BACT|nr:type II toxin-antitoxin system RelE/ParE family toxin [Aquirufa sp. LEOWEIH-7C]MDU0809246.1 type II toxin-antitoxin system RelE/ParE family toxin [Aquirufa sp. LEOWEIH-7C]
MKPVREVIFFGTYFSTFFESQTEKVKEKIDYVLFVLTHTERVPDKFLKHLSGHEDLYEIRVSYAGNIFRIFCFFDHGKLVVLLNGYQKKSQKTAVREIELAKKLKEAYFNL